MAAEEAILTFFRAIFDGAVAEVGRLLDEDGRLVGGQLGEGHTPLHLAVAQGRVDMVRLLLGRGADIEAINEQGCTALHLAVSSNHEEIQNVLLDCGADASRAGFRGVTPLTAAVGLGDMDTVRRLLRSLGGRGLDAQVDIGVTAFLWACGDGRADIARLLLLEGADHTIGWQEGTPAARMAEEAKGHEECVALIQWWEGELERAYVVHRARYHMEQNAILQPYLQALASVPATRPVPAHLRPRLSLPHVEIVASLEGEQQTVQGGSSGKRKEAEQGAQGPCEGEKDATLKYVMHDLAPELYIELMAGFH